MVNESFTPSGDCDGVLDVLKTGRANPRHVIDETGLEKTLVEYWLTRLTDAGWVSKPSRGLYAFEVDPRTGEEAGDSHDTDALVTAGGAGSTDSAGNSVVDFESELAEVTADRLEYQFIWSTTGDMPLLTGEIKTELETYLTEHAVELGVTIRELGVAPDHVRLRIGAPPTLAPHTAASHLKAHSSRRLHEDTDIDVDGDFTRSAGSERDTDSDSDSTTDMNPETDTATDGHSPVWTDGYFVSSAGDVTDDAVRTYLDAQAER
jgi:REP element-mobilizing transposase RayT